MFNTTLSAYNQSLNIMIMSIFLNKNKKRANGLKIFKQSVKFSHKDDLTKMVTPLISLPKMSEKVIRLTSSDRIILKVR